MHGGDYYSGGSGGLQDEYYDYSSYGGGGNYKPVETCNFFTTTGTCQFGDSCRRIHNRPTTSTTVLLPTFYPNPLALPRTAQDGSPIERNWRFEDKYLKDHFEQFYKDFWGHMSRFGPIKQMVVVKNLNDHLVGNVYVQFMDEAVASRVVEDLHDKPYNGDKHGPLLMTPELSPVQDFTKGAACPSYSNPQRHCERGEDKCNRLHIFDPGESLVEQLKNAQRKQHSLHSSSHSKRNRENEVSRDSRNKDSHKRDHHRHHSDRHEKRDKNGDDRRKHHSRRDDEEERHHHRHHRRDAGHRSKRPRSEERKSDSSRDRTASKKDRSNRGGSRGQLCDICGKLGHISRDCRQR